MIRIQAIVIVLGLLFSIPAMADSKQTDSAGNKIIPLPRDLEIHLALSSLPSHLRDEATVYILNPDRGYEIDRKGSNGFHALVDRIDSGGFYRGSWPYTKYRDDMLVPISFDGAGAKEQMRVIVDAAKMRAEGTPPAELKKIINQRFKTGYYKAPERVGVSYMLSPVLRAYQNPDQSDTVMTHNYPHYMFYAPNVSDEDIGGKMLSPHLFIITYGPHGYIIKGVGQKERAVINKEYEEMIERLCKFKKEFCLPTPGMR